MPNSGPSMPIWRRFTSTPFWDKFFVPGDQTWIHNYLLALLFNREKNLFRSFYTPNKRFRVIAGSQNRQGRKEGDIRDREMIFFE